MPKDPIRDDDEAVQKVLAECLEAVERGETIDRERLKRELPDRAASICEFLDNNRLFSDAIGKFRNIGQKGTVNSDFAPTVDSQSAKAPTQFQIGDSLRYIGEYEILCEIARGGMGIVFKARQSTLKRVVALKMILAGRLASDSDVDRFHREARVAAALRHPNIVGVHEIGKHKGHHYFTMDFVSGKSLASIISEGAISPKYAANLIKKIAIAIEYAHKNGVLHRDLKPANILVDAEDQPHITDFGLAKTMVENATRTDLTMPGQILGTPSYMSPEQALAKHQLVSVASDVYSLGAILYACLSGRAPFVADTTVDTIRQLLDKEPVSLQLLNPKVPRDLETICFKCLQKDPCRRYVSAGELVQDVGRFLEGRPVVARPVPALTKLWRWGSRNPWIASFATLSILLLLTGTLVSTHFAVLATQSARDESLQRMRADLETKSANNSKDSMQVALDRERQAKDLAEESLLTARWNIYKMALFPLLKAWQDENFGLLRARLDASIPVGDEPDFRNWEWYLFHNSVAERTVASTNMRRYHFVEYDYAGLYVAARRTDNAIDILDSQTLAVLHSLPGTTQSHFAWHPFKHWLAAADANNDLKVWDVRSEQVLYEFNTNDDETTMTTRGVAWNPSGTIVALGGFRRIDLFDLGKGFVKKLEYFYEGRVMDWSPDGKSIAVGGRSTACVIDVETSRQLWWNYRSQVDINDLKWNKEGTVLAAAWAYPDSCVRLYDLEGAVIHSLRAGQSIFALNWLEDDATLVFAGSDQHVNFGDSTKGVHLRTLAVSNDIIESMDVDLGSGRAVLASADGVLQTIPLADLPQFELEVNVSTGPTLTHQLQWHPTDANLLVVSSPSVAHVVDVEKGKILQSFSGLSRFATLDWHPTERRFTTLENSGRIVHYDLDSVNPVESVEAWKVARAIDGVALKWSPDGGRMLIGTGQKQMENLSFSVAVFDPEYESKRIFLGDYSPRSVARWSPNSKSIAVRCWRGDKTIQIWDLETQTVQLRSEPLEGFLEQMEYSPDGKRIALGGNGGAVVIYDVVANKIIVNQNADSAIIRSIHWSPDGTRLLTCAGNGTLRLWDSGQRD